MNPQKKHHQRKKEILLTSNKFPILQDKIGTPCLVRVCENYYPGIVAHQPDSELALLAFVNSYGLCGTTLEQKIDKSSASQPPKIITQHAYILENNAGLDYLLPPYGQVRYYVMDDWTRKVYGQLKGHKDKFLAAGYNLSNYLEE